MHIFYHDKKPVSPQMSFLKPFTTEKTNSPCLEKKTNPADPRALHHSGIYLPTTHLFSLGIYTCKLPPWSPSSGPSLTNLAIENACNHYDEITIAPHAIDTGYEEITKLFYDEHMHEDDEIRWVREGSGFFDVRDAYDDWIRIWAEKGDFISLPAGIYHRFSVDQGQVGGFDSALLCFSRL